MKLAIIGSRGFTQYSFAQRHINQIIAKENLTITQIVSGGAKGADQIGADYALKNQLELIIFKPDWKKYGRAAGVLRNTQIIEYSQCVIAFWDGSSKGTKDAITKAKSLGKMIHVVLVPKQLDTTL